VTDPTQRIGPPPEEPEEEPPAPAAGPTATVMGVVAALVVILLIVVIFVATRDPAEPVAVPTTPPPTTEPTTEPPTPEPTTEPPSPTPSPSPTTEPPQGDREPTDADVAAFANRYQPPGGEQVDSVAVDVNADGRREVVFASIVADTTRIDVAAWDGQAYQVVYVGQGGPAEELTDLIIRDYTGDDTREIVTFQTVGEEGQSLSIWGWDGQRFTDQRAQGGCWNGQNTFGIVGATIRVEEISATCDGSPLPTDAWPTETYRWNGMAWVYDGTSGPG
jgi:hypothetical protein